MFVNSVTRWQGEVTKHSTPASILVAQEAGWILNLDNPALLNFIFA